MPQIKNIAHLQTGVYAKTDRYGNAVYLRVKYFNDNGELAELLQPDLYLDELLSRHLLNEGDVLFAAKGERNYAAVYKSAFGPCVASSSFFIIRRSKDILPEFLAWYINNPHSMKILKAEAKGSSIQSISIKSIGELEIQVPPIKTQQAILKVDALHIREKELLSEISLLRDKLINTQLLSSI